MKTARMIIYDIDAKKVVVPDGLGNFLDNTDIYNMGFSRGYREGYAVGADECQNA